MNGTRFLHYPVSDLTRQEIVGGITRRSQEPGVAFITVMNANKMFLYDKSADCRRSVDESFMVLPENAINIGMKWLGTPLKEWDVGGVEIAKELLANTGLKAFLLGAKQEILDMVINHPLYGKNIAGVHHGYFREDEVGKIAGMIRECNPDIILLGLGSPKQEILMQKLKPLLEKGILLGVGGTFDVLAGVKKDAPKWSKRGLEWLYRAAQDPKKFKRYVKVNSYYLFKLASWLIKQK